jgi:hypothetical protein
LERITQRLSARIPIGTGYLTMADLDEALFAVDGVLNFTATSIHHARGDELQLAVKMLDDVDANSSIIPALSRLPILNDVTINSTIVPDIPPSMAKRTILDRRHHA